MYINKVVSSCFCVKIRKLYVVYEDIDFSHGVLTLLMGFSYNSVIFCILALGDKKRFICVGGLNSLLICRSTDEV